LVAGLVPSVEPAHDENLFGVGSPNSEVGALDSVDDPGMRPQALV